MPSRSRRHGGGGRRGEVGEEESSSTAGCAGFLILMSIVGFTLLSVGPSASSKTFEAVECTVVSNEIPHENECTCSLYCKSKAPCVQISVEYVYKKTNETITTMAHQSARSLYMHSLCTLDISTCSKFSDLNRQRVWAYKNKYTVGGKAKCYYSKFNNKDVILGPPISGSLQPPAKMAPLYQQIMWPVIIFVLGIMCLLMDKDTREVIKGAVKSPDDVRGWFKSAWEYVKLYCKSKLGFRSSNSGDSRRNRRDEELGNGCEDEDNSDTEAPPAYSEWPEEDAVVLRRYLGRNSVRGEGGGDRSNVEYIEVQTFDVPDEPPPGYVDAVQDASQEGPGVPQSGQTQARLSLPSDGEEGTFVGSGGEDQAPNETGVAMSEQVRLNDNQEDVQSDDEDCGEMTRLTTRE
eukprot:Nk52_evm29s294 gene=Nk52_evmTU29s294